MGHTDFVHSFQKKRVKESGTALGYVAWRHYGISSLEVLKAWLDKDRHHAGSCPASSRTLHCGPSEVPFHHHFQDFMKNTASLSLKRAD